MSWINILRVSGGRATSSSMVRAAIPDAIGLAAVERSELGEVGLQVLCLDRAGMRTEQPALQE